MNENISLLKEKRQSLIHVHVNQTKVVRSIVPGCHDFSQYLFFLLGVNCFEFYLNQSGLQESCQN